MRARARISVAAAALLAAAPALAQAGRASSVERGASRGTDPTLDAPRSTLDARVAPNDTNTVSFDVNGLPVILRRVTSNEVVAANLYLLGGTRQAGAEQAGLEPFLLDATERGTQKYSRDVLAEKMARLGSLIGVDADHDWTTFAMRSTTATFDSTWAIFADRLMRPTLDSGEVELLRGRLLSGVRQRRDSPDAQLEYLADSLAFDGHPYGIAPRGTEASLRRIALADLRKYQREQMVTSRMLLVVVGDVDRAKLERVVAATLGTLPKGSYAWQPPAPPPARPSAVAVERRDLPTNYLLGYFPGPAASSPDYYPLRIATAVLSGRFFAEIRSKRNLSYAVHAPFVDRAVATGGVYVTTVDPRTTLALMREELRNLQEGWITPRGLDQLRQQFITEYFLDNETNADQANFLARAQLYRGDWKRAARFVEELRAVTPDDVRRVARQYLHDLRLAYIGNPARLDESMVKGF
ncbi:pitrilysin family protein [Roseisolibacter sp. H3M3-2]|uniref:M16 family metallopeptidase n=1 Tax=Roseisolibacter sp. H3M3-2 TaxID=3031323 RepID=UPI0023DB7905|nr:pitrilysin family protein [Roseisolibacter sp. H3M3-2]MDF1502916.1 pitrilysin family protein [Roseisolibacter sp. H3M3-2]